MGGAIQGFIISLIEQQIRLILGAALSVPSSAPSNGLVGGMICSIYGMAKIQVKKCFFSPLFYGGVDTHLIINYWKETFANQ